MCQKTQLCGAGTQVSKCKKSRLIISLIKITHKIMWSHIQPNKQYRETAGWGIKLFWRKSWRYVIQRGLLQKGNLQSQEPSKNYVCTKSNTKGI